MPWIHPPLRGALASIVSSIRPIGAKINLDAELSAN